MTSRTLIRKPPTNLSIAIPASFIDVYSNLAQKTDQVGRIARAAAINQVIEILVFPDVSSQKQVTQRQLITRILEYLDTPQYLRKHLFGKLPELRRVGILPPLRTPHHPIEKRARNLSDSEIREGYAYRKEGKLVVDVGVENPLPFLKPGSLRIPCRVTVSITRKTNGILTAQPAAPPTPETYWGYKVLDIQQPLSDFLRRNRVYDLVIATSRRAPPINEIWTELRSRWKRAKNVLVLFGSHSKGLREILQRDDQQMPDLTDFLVNTVPNQGVETIRTAEAVFLSLPLFRLLEESFD
jgi:predicted SPOUT superfamily RNA methylase MTH1